MQAFWSRIIFRALLAAFGSLVASLLIVSVLVPQMGGTVEGVGLLMAIICPVAIAGPASGVQFYQLERLKQARVALTRSHLELDNLHRDLIAAHAAVIEASLRDPMTGAYNRIGFMQRMSESTSTQGTVLFIDADRFKSINDRFGHRTGDQALQTIAKALRKGLRPDDFLGRIGGEEFVIFLDGVTAPADIDRMANVFLKSVSSTPLLTDTGAIVDLSISIGTASFSALCDADELLREADARMYEAKRDGRNRAVIGRDVSTPLTFSLAGPSAPC
ncbi:diguanylate cyclase [Agrobacterium larrymoorei]|uniref:GGDEF domain-containing protein n=1 Tax=Agrobacterium larrymoorei TaxID=160699 RepID=UPI0030C0E62D